MNFWLMKSEPSSFSLDDLMREKTTFWDGVRNYQARNFMRDSMRVGDAVLIYHSNCSPPGIAGRGKVKKTGIVDHTQFDKTSKYYDPKASQENPRWMMVEIGFKEKFTRFIELEFLKKEKPLKEMKVLQKGNRLSITPLSRGEFEHIVKLGSGKS